MTFDKRRGVNTISFWEDLKVWWCLKFHPRTYWPVNGVYRCATCHKLYAIPGTPMHKIPLGVYFRKEEHSKYATAQL